MDIRNIKAFLDRKVDEYNQPSFISHDPIVVPHRFSRKQDIEIAGFFASVFAWGNRTTIIQKTQELMRLMDNAPYAFCLDPDMKTLIKAPVFRHRTFNSTDLLYFISFLHRHYRRYDSLEDAFLKPADSNSGEMMESALNGFYDYFFSLEDAPARTHKHIAAPRKKSTCKRLNMFLRWMVRTDGRHVDFGIWKKFSPSRLICPVDLHVARVARRFGLITRRQTDWQTALELTAHLRILDEADPVKYDFALFALGVIEHF